MIRQHCKLIFFILTLIPLLSSSQQTPQRSLSFYPDNVVLIGRIIYKMFYGPPNYGEDPKNDKKEYFYLIELDHPVSVNAKADDEDNMSIASISTIQIFDAKHLLSKQYIGKRAKLVGTLHSATIGHEHTKVVIDVTSVSLAQ